MDFYDKREEWSLFLKMNFHKNTSHLTFGIFRMENRDLSIISINTFMLSHTDDWVKS